MRKKILSVILTAALGLYPVCAAFAADGYLPEEDAAGEILSEDWLEEEALGEEAPAETDSEQEYWLEPSEEEVRMEAAKTEEDSDGPDREEPDLAEAAGNNLILDVEEVWDQELPDGQEDIVEQDELIALEGSGDAQDAALFRGRAGWTQYTDSYGAQLSGEAKEIYLAMVSNWVSQKKSGDIAYTLKTDLSFAVYPVTVNGQTDWQLDGNEEYQKLVKETLKRFVQSAYDAFLYDYPEVFWLGGMSYGYSTTLNKTQGRGRISAVTLRPSEKYAGAASEIEAFERSVNAEAAAIEASVGSGASLYQKVRAIHDYLCNTLTYRENAYAHTAAGVFLKSREVVCEGYAKAFKILCGRMGVEAVLVPGDALKRDGTREGHMWNHVRMENGNWYLVDVTWDDQPYGISDTYFLAGSSCQGFVSVISEEHLTYNNFSGSVYAQSFGIPEISAFAYASGTALHTHRWEKTEEQAATCRMEGIAKYICADQNCKAVKEEIENQLPHIYGPYVSDGNATCTKDGTKTASCISCGEKDTLPDHGSCGHRFGQYVPEGNATVFSDGTKTARCTRCGSTDRIVDAGTRLTPTMVLNVSKLTLQVGQSTTALKVGGLARGDSVKSWKTSDRSVAVVSQSGKITAKKKTGSANITAVLASGSQAAVRVTVQKKAVKTTAIRSVPKTLALQIGKTAKLQPVLAPVTSKEKITYTTSSKKIAEVSKNGVIRGRKAGTARITVKAGSKKAVVKVTVKAPVTKKISNIPGAVSLKKGKSKILKPKLTPAGSKQKVTYQSSNKKVASVSAKGKITAKKKGSAVITVKSGSVTVKCKVTVK